MNHSKIWSLIIVLLALTGAMTLVGCGGSGNGEEADATGTTATQRQASPVGTWTLDTEATLAELRAEIAATDNDFERGMLEMMLEMFSEMSVTLVVNEDGTSTATMIDEDGPDTITGTWTLVDGTFSMTASNDGGPEETLSGPFTGESLTLAPPEEEAPFAFIFKRE